MLTTYSYAQVGISTNNPNKNAVLDLNKTDGTNTKGLLLPRVSLNSTTDYAPMEAHIAGIKVYNTATAGTGTTAVSPGEYYNDGTQWLRMTTNFWQLDGNTVSSIKTIGTSDNFDLPVVTNNTEKMRMTTGGQLLINTTAPLSGGSTAKLQVNNGTTPGAVQIVDGTQGAGKFLTSDANGTASWKAPVSQYTILGVIPAPTTNAVTASNTYFYTGCYIDLPAGSWNVYATMWFEAQGTAAVKPSTSNQGYLSFSLSTSSTLNTPPFYASTMRNYILQSLYFGAAGLSHYGGGSIPITLSSAQRIYVWGFVSAITFGAGLPASPNPAVANVLSANNAPGAYGPYTQLYATPINF